MSCLRTILSVVGGVVIILYIAGALGFGNFKLYYGAAKLICTKEAK